MPTAMSAKAIAQTAYKAGWRGEQLVIAVAVALAESSGQYWVVNSIGCVGLWQINVPVHHQYTTAGMKDPDANAAAAMAIYKGAGSKWSPWEAYTGPSGHGSSGPYLVQMGRARMAVAQVDTSAATNASTSTGGGGGGSVNQASYETIAGADQAGLESIVPELPSLIGPLYQFLSNGGAGSLGDSMGSLNPFGPLAVMGKAFLAISLLIVRASAWLANPKNWLRVVEVIGGAAALFIGLKMLASSGIDSPVSNAARAGFNTASKVTGAAKKAGEATAAVATGGTTAAIGAAAATAAKVKG